MTEDSGGEKVEEEEEESEYGTPEGRANALSPSSLESYSSVKKKSPLPANIILTNNDDDDDEKKKTREERRHPHSPEYSTPQMRVKTSFNNSSVVGGGINRAASPSLMSASPRNNINNNNNRVSSPSSPSTSSLLTPTKRTNNKSNNTSVSRASSSRASNVDVSSVQSLMLANTHAVNDLQKRVMCVTSHREKCISLLSNAHALQLALIEANQTHEMLDPQSLTQLKKIMISCLGVLRLCVARVDAVGNLSILEKAFTRYGILSSSSNKKFTSLQSDLEIIETQLWNLTGASGGGIASKTQSIASLTRRSRLLRGGFTTAMNKVVFGSGVTEMIACGVDCSELWIANETRFPRRSGTLQVTDLFLNERRELEYGGRLDGSSSGDSSGARSGKNSGGTDSNSIGMGGCFLSLGKSDKYSDDVDVNVYKTGMSSLSMRVSEKPRGAITVMTKGSGACAALLFVGTSAGDVCVWDVDMGKRNENAVMKVRKGVSATAMRIVDDDDDDDYSSDIDEDDGLVDGDKENDTNEARALALQKDKFQNCTLWTGFADGSILEVIAKVKIKSRRQNSSVGNSQNTSPGDSWKFDNEVDRIAGADFEVYLRLGRLIRGEVDGFGVSKRAVKFIVYLNGHVYVPYTNATATTKYANENLEVWSTKSGKCIASNEVHKDLGLVEECVAYKDAECVVTLHQAEGTFGSALGTVQLWGGRGIAPEARSAKINEIPFGSLACSVDIVEFASLLIIGHVSGHITIWKLPSSDELDAFVTKRVDERSLNLGVPGKILAHRSGMVSMCGVHAVSGSHSGVATAGTFGSVLLWPMTELESAADRAIRENGGKMRRKKRIQPSQEKLSAGLTSSRTASRDLSPMLSKDRSDGSSEIGKKFIHTPSEKRMASHLNTTLITQSEVTLKRKIGEGSFGRVHVALWNHVQVAVKFIGTEGMEESSDLRIAMDELEKEVSIMTNLRHPNIVALFGIMRYPPAIVEEYCARGSLFSVLQRHAKPGVPALQWRVRLRLALGAACGMCYLHNCAPPVIHRDLKSANLMVDASFRVKVGDFNLSRVTAANRATGNSVSTSVNLHSPRWSAPEVLDTGDYSKASDVYSFGIVLWEILTLELPWAEWSHWQVLHAVIELEERPEIPAKVSPHFHAIDKFTHLMRLCWSQKSVDRPMFETIIQTLQKMIESAEKFEEQERLKMNNSGANSATAGSAVVTRKSGSLPKSIRIFSANEREKAPAASSSRSNVGNTNNNKGSENNKDDVVNNNDNDDDDDAVVIIEDKRKKSEVAPSDSKAAATRNTNNDSLTSPPSQKSSSILAGIESRKSFNTRQSRVKSPYKSPSKILRGLKSISKSADL